MSAEHPFTLFCDTTELIRKWFSPTPPQRHPSLRLRGFAPSHAWAIPVAFDKGDKVADKATKLMPALKGRDIPAQGNALGNRAKNRRALKGRDIVPEKRPAIPLMIGRAFSPCLYLPRFPRASP